MNFHSEPFSASSHRRSTAETSDRKRRSNVNVTNDASTIYLIAFVEHSTRHSGDLREKKPKKLSIFEVSFGLHINYTSTTHQPERGALQTLNKNSSATNSNIDGQQNALQHSNEALWHREKCEFRPDSGELWLQRIFHAIFFFSALFYASPPHSRSFPATCFRFVCNKWIMLNEWKIVFTLISHFVPNEQSAAPATTGGVESNGIFSFSFSHFSPSLRVCCLCGNIFFLISRLAGMYAGIGVGGWKKIL